MARAIRGPRKSAVSSAAKSPANLSTAKNPTSAASPTDTPAEPLSVLLIASEAHPFAKTGGLADVLGALPPALARLGHDVTVVLPKYQGVAAGSIIESFPLTIGAYTRDVGFHEVPMSDGARAVLVDCPELYDRPGIYAIDGADYPDNARRFAMLTRAALEFAARRSPAPSVIHAHDWQAGLAPVYLKTLYASHPVLGSIPSVFTIHNLAYQGVFDADWLPRLDLGWELFTLDRMEFWNRISFLKGGINHAELVTTVSRRYAEEIQTPEFGFGFDGIVRARAAHLVGILNGVDTREWDPAADEHLPQPYSRADLSGKAAAKAEVLARFSLPHTGTALERPLIGMVSRMVDQKGLDLIAALADRLPQLDATFVALGTGEPRYQEMWRRLAAQHPARIGAQIGFDEGLAHLIEGGADMFLMPSQYEPSGLNQMYSLRYGTVPVVRAVGGLADTVIDYDPTTPKRPGQPPSTGFVFKEYTAAALLDALNRALSTYRDRRKWRALQVAGMRQDFSWDRSAAEYVKMYRRAMEERAV